MNNEDYAVIGSKLKLDAHLRQISASLSETIALLKEAAKAYRACHTTASEAATREKTIARTNALLNNILAEYRKANKVTESITSLIGPALPDMKLGIEIEQGKFPIDATDEGCAEALADIAAKDTTVDRMEAVCEYAESLSETSEEYDKDIAKLKKRISNGSFDKSAENRAETSQAANMIKAKRQRKAQLDIRLKKALNIFFHALKTHIETVEAPLKHLKRIFPYGSEATQMAAREFLSSDSISVISMLEAELRNPVKPPIKRPRKKAQS